MLSQQWRTNFSPTAKKDQLTVASLTEMTLSLFPIMSVNSFVLGLSTLYPLYRMLLSFLCMCFICSSISSILILWSFSQQISSIHSGKYNFGEFYWNYGWCLQTCFWNNRDKSRIWGVFLGCIVCCFLGRRVVIVWLVWGCVLFGLFFPDWLNLKQNTTKMILWKICSRTIFLSRSVYNLYYYL